MQNIEISTVDTPYINSQFETTRFLGFFNFAMKAAAKHEIEHFNLILSPQLGTQGGGKYSDQLEASKRVVVTRKVLTAKKGRHSSLRGNYI